MTRASATPTRLSGELAELVTSADISRWPNRPELWQDLRREAPVAWNGPYLVLSRYDDVKEGLRDRRFGKVLTGSTAAADERARLEPADRELLDELIAFESMWMVRTPTEDDHDRIRRIVHRAFTPRAIDAMRASVDRLADELLDQLENDHDAAAFGYRLPLGVITEMLGVPAADREQVHAWSLRISEGLRREPERIRASIAAIREFRVYVDDIVARHRRDPGSVAPLVAAILDAEEDEQLTPAELTATFVQLLFAGHETTSALIQQGLIELQSERGQWELLRRDPAQAPAAVEELLRLVPPVAEMWRVAYDDCDLLGVSVARGQSVRLLIAAANRDPAVFDDPERLDIARPNAREHLSLGFGPRFCLGASLARLEAATALRKLAQRFPRLTLASDELQGQRGPGLRTLESIPVQLS